MGGKKKGGFFFKWIKSDLPDREENPSPVLLLAVHKSSGFPDKGGSPDCFSLPRTHCCDSCAPHTERNRHLFSHLNERFKKTLSLDSRVNRSNCKHTNHDFRPKSMVNATATNVELNGCSNTTEKSCKKKRFRPKSFFTLETFLDSRRSEASSADDFSSSKYCKFYLDSSAECSPILKGRTTPDLLDLPTITDNVSHTLEESRSKKRLDKLENHFNKVQKLKNARQPSVGTYKNVKDNLQLNEEAIYTEPVYEIPARTKTDTLNNVVFTSENNFVRKPDHDSVKKFDNKNTKTLEIDRRTERDKFLRAEPYSPIYTNFTRTCNRPHRFNHPESRPDRESHENNNVEHELSQTPVPRCSNFKDCSNAFSKVCNSNCSNSRNLIKSGGICCKEGTPSSAYEIYISEDDVLVNDKTKNLVVKVMDKSVDSIGSCSLDVDADNTDFSDTTSGSLNILTPSSTTSHYKDFASKFQERATPGLKQEFRGLLSREENFGISNNSEDNSVQLNTAQHFSNISVQPKKPSYLHLACSINGYSSLTTYDSTLRQKLSRSRENSPARPGNISSFIMLRNRADDAMTQRLNGSNVNNSNSPFFKTSFSETSISSQNVLTYLKSNGQTASSETHTSKSFHVISNGASKSDSPSKSVIQQSVERLYGPGALAQGFFNSKRHFKDVENNVQNGVSQVSRTQHVTVKKSQNGVVSENSYSVSENYSNGKTDIESVPPVMRHLRPEFRAQLPMVSPKRSPLAKISDNNSFPTNFTSNRINPPETRLSERDEVDRSASRHDNQADKKSPVVTIIPICKSESRERNDVSPVNGDISKTAIVSSDVILNTEIENDRIKTSVDQTVSVKQENIPLNNLTNERIVETEKDVNVVSELKSKELTQDGQYFLDLKRKENENLLKIADMAESYLEELKALPDVNEEVTGYLRSAAGKARLLASQKMQQFEGLCHNNINSQPDDQYPTTVEDLKGFWDMVCLQIDDVKALSEQIVKMKASNWTEIPFDKRTSDNLAAKATPAKSRILKTKKSPSVQSESSPSVKSLAAKKRDEQRKALLEAKRRAVKADCDSSVEIFAPPPPSSTVATPSETKTDES